MNLRKIFLITALFTSPFYLIYGMDDKMDDGRDDEFRCFLGVPQPLLEYEAMEQSSDATHEDLQMQTSDAQSLVEKIKHEITTLNLTAIGSLLASEPAARLTSEQRRELYQEALGREEEISKLLEDGICISGAAGNIERIISYLYAFQFIEKFEFPRTLFTNPPYHRKIHPEIGPNVPLNSVLDALIKNEKEGILVCCFHISDSEIAKSLMFRNRVGVKVEIVTNQQQAENMSAIKLLIRSGIEVSCPAGHRFETDHHKFIIFKRNILNKCLVWHGSYNPTNFSNTSAWEDVTIDDNPEVHQRYSARFLEIKAASTRMTIDMLPKTH